MIQRWTPERAAELLRNRDVLRYSDPLAYLESPQSIEFPDSLTILATPESAGLSMAIAMDSTFRDGIYLTVHLVADMPDRLPELLSALPTDKPTCYYLYDASLSRHFSERYILEPFGSRVDLHADSTTIRDTPVDDSNIRRLDAGDRDLVQGDESMEHYWSVTTGSKDSPFDTFGLVIDGELVSMITTGPRHELSKSLVTREIVWISTKPGYQRKGFASRLLTHGTRFIISQGATALYSLSDDNAASLATAKSVGYVEHLHSESFLTREPLRERRHQLISPRPEHNVDGSSEGASE